MTEVAAWEREFQVWQYSVSHAVLLLRSIRPQEYETRIDVVFPAVSLMRLKPGFARLSIRTATRSEEEALLSGPFEPSAHGNLYLLNDGEGYVRAAACEWHEDRGNHHDPSHFGPLRGTA